VSKGVEDHFLHNALKFGGILELVWFATAETVGAFDSSMCN